MEFGLFRTMWTIKGKVVILPVQSLILNQRKGEGKALPLVRSL